MQKISSNPNLKEISRFTWNWGYAWGNGDPKKYALSGCIKSAEKYKLFGGECILIDLAIKKSDQHINLLKPKLTSLSQTDTESETSNIIKIIEPNLFPLILIGFSLVPSKLIEPSDRNIALFSKNIFIPPLITNSLFFGKYIF